ncbi:MAG TPA: NADH-dependent [FeFe] hydrogenase, group A6 [Clostridiales bacterium]|nr:NADH-dependent [FeFe] hydrogenase, group A6 [Clostridiales bacterium]
MAKLTIDGQSVEVKDGSTILDAAKAINIKIPTLCYHPDQSVKANCRICVVEVEGQRLLVPACAYPVSDGMVVKTTTARVRKARMNILELIFSHHSKNCLECDRNGNCELQTIAEDMHFIRDLRYPLELRGHGKDMSSPSITRDPSKCIVCDRCLVACNDVQTVFALNKENRGFPTVVTPVFGRSLADTVCISCGQCVQACPVGALVVHDDREPVWQVIEGNEKEVVAQVAPAVRVTIAEALGEDPGIVSTGRLVTAMKRIGFDKVFDTNVTADLTIMEEGTEFITRLTSGGALPMITSCSPGWINFCETYYPELLPNLSSCKSPQGMFGALIKTYYAQKMGKDPKDIFSVSIMPCTAKKFEAKRPELATNGNPDIDAVLTVQELARMIEQCGITFKDLPETDFDDPFGLGSGAGVIFGSTGGVMEAALRSVYEIITKQPLADINFKAVRGFQGVKEATIPIGDLNVKVAVAHSTGHARKLMDAVRDGKAEYHFIEIMACPGGCIGGGGNPIKNWAKMQLRFDAIYQADVNLPVRQSHKNPVIKELYQDFLGEPNSHVAHDLLHTTYRDRSNLLK